MPAVKICPQILMIDLHSHILPGLDDGARTIDESVALARALAADGVRVVVAAPHVRDDYPTSPDAMEAALALVREAVAADGLSLRVLGGGEIALPRLGALGAGELERFALGGSRVVLLEPPTLGWPVDLVRTCALLARDGWVPMLAHPERSAEVQERPALLEELVRAGALVQLTAASVDGRLGRRPAECARELLRLGLAHALASDAHGPGVREAGLSGAVAALGGGALGRWLVEDVPAALLAGEEVPARPVGGARRRWWWRRPTAPGD